VTLREEQRGQSPPFKEKNLLVRNIGAGKFADVTAQAGEALQQLEVTRGAAFGDVDNDGDVDIVITNNNGSARLLLNGAEHKNAWLELRLEGKDKVNRDALGARVTVIREGAPNLVRRVHTDSSYCSASDRRLHFGLGANFAIRAIEVEWPDGSSERWETHVMNQVVTLVRGTGHIH
jgi:enediyne biosynthesis protein E4